MGIYLSTPCTDISTEEGSGMQLHYAIGEMQVMDVCMDVWMDDWMDGWMDDCIYAINICVYDCIYVLMHHTRMK